MLLINCEINVKLTWSANCVITNLAGSGTFEIIDTKPYIPAINLWIQENIKLLGQLKSGFKRVIKWKKYTLEFQSYTQNHHLNYLIDPSFQGVNGLFMLHSTCRILSSNCGNKRLKRYD